MAESTSGTNRQTAETESEDYTSPVKRLNTKDTLFMLLALHMEKSPLCEEPIKDEINRTGIVVCESDSLQKVLAMDCSRKQLHAAQLVTLNLTSRITGCNVYLSRKPCTECAKCLVQGRVQSIFYWPKEPEVKKGQKLEENSRKVNQILRSSSTLLVPLMPAIDGNIAETKLCQRTRRQKCQECLKSSLIEELETELKSNWKNCGLPSYYDNENLITCTLRNYNELLNCDHGTCTDDSTVTLELVIHLLQLCFLLAARSDDPRNGVGAIIYNTQHQYIVGAGYNGYIERATYGNFPRCGRDSKRTRAKREYVVHAEVNALLFRSVTDTDSAVLVSSKMPCSGCKKAIIASGIKTVITVCEDKKEEEGPKEPGEGDKEADLKIIEWKCPRDLQVAEQSSEQPDPQPESPGDPTRLPKKDDLMMYLALHMERSPLCEEPKEKDNIKFCKTGITILNTKDSNHILAIDCSRNGLHAVQKALLSSPRHLQGCTVYLSRYPCITCAKLLIQGGVHRVCYWLNLELEKKKPEEKPEDWVPKDDIISVSHLFLEARVICDMYIPLVDLDTVQKKISQKTGVITTDLTECRSIFNLSQNVIVNILAGLDLLHINEKSYQDEFKKQVQNAYDCYGTLINSSDGSFEPNRSPRDQDDISEVGQPSEPEGNEKRKHIHALQLCFLLAARTDNPGKAIGVGALICQDDCFVGMGYNGFPKGDRCSHYLHSEKRENLLICAEANALYFRYKQDLKEATLYTSNYPCPECMDLITTVGGITKIVCVKPKEKKPHPPPKGVTCWMWKQNTKLKGTSARSLDTSSTQEPEQDPNNEG